MLKSLSLIILLFSIKAYPSKYVTPYAKEIDMMKAKPPKELSTFDWDFYSLDMEKGLQRKIEAHKVIYENNESDSRDEELGDIRKELVKKYIDKKVLRPSVEKVRNSSAEARYIGEQFDKISGKSQLETSFFDSFKIGTKADVLNGEARLWLENKAINSRLKIAYEDDHPGFSIRKPIDTTNIPFVPTKLLDYEFGYYLDDQVVYSNVKTYLFETFNFSMLSVHDSSKESVYSLFYELEF